MADDERTVQRKVYFFRIAHFDQLRNGLPSALAKIENLAFREGGRYLNDPIDKVRLLAYPDALSYPLRLRFGRTRTDLLPDVEQAGQLTSLELSEDGGLFDVCHIVIFDDGHVAAEFNRDGPRINKLGDYLFVKGHGLTFAPRFLKLYQRDIVEVLSELDSVKVFEIEVEPQNAALIREADRDLEAAILASERAGSSQKVGLTLTGDNSTNRLRDLARRFAALIKSKPQERSRFGRLEASGYVAGSSVRRYVDLLEEQLVSGEVFIRRSPPSRSLDKDKAYAVIERAYVNHKQTLAAAAVATDLW